MLSDDAANGVRRYRALFDGVPAADGAYDLVLEVYDGAVADGSAEAWASAARMVSVRHVTLASRGTLARVDAVSPTAVPAGEPSDAERVVTLHGANFADVGYLVTLACDDGSTGTAPVTFVSSSVLTARLPDREVWATCRLTLLDEEENVYRVPSRVSYTNAEHHAGSAKASGYGLASKVCGGCAAGWSGRLGRFVYVLGGSSGRACGTQMALDAVQVAPLDEYGLGAGTVFLTKALPAPVVHASAVAVGSNLVVFGGVGPGGTGAVVVGHILQPEEAPVVRAAYTLLDGTARSSRARNARDSHDAHDTNDAHATNGEHATSDTHGGSAPGSYTYAVSAVYCDTHATLPGAESLRSLEVTVRVPAAKAFADRTQGVAVWWERVPGACGYRVYRLNGATGGDELLRSVGDGDTTWVVDAGLAPENSSAAPPVPGAVGAWVRAQNQPQTPRAGAALVAQRYGDAWRVLLFGGVDAKGAELGDVERTVLTALAPGARYEAEQVRVGTFDKDTKTAPPRAHRRAVLLDAAAMPTYASADAVVVLGPGTVSGKPQPQAHEAAVGTVSLGDFREAEPGHVSAGYCLHLSAGYLYAFGGTAGASAEGVKSEFLKLGTAPPPDEDPLAQHFAPLPDGRAPALAFPACLSYQGAAYLIGGAAKDELSRTLYKIDL